MQSTLVFVCLGLTHIPPSRAKYPALTTPPGFNRTWIGGVHLKLCTFSASGALSTIGNSPHGISDLDSFLHTFLISTLLFWNFLGWNHLDLVNRSLPTGNWPPLITLRLWEHDTTFKTHLFSHSRFSCRLFFPLFSFLYLSLSAFVMVSERCGELCKFFLVCLSIVLRTL